MFRQQTAITMKIYVISSLVFGSLFGVIFAASTDNSTVETTTFDETIHPNITTFSSVVTTPENASTEHPSTTHSSTTPPEPPATTPLPTPGPHEDPKAGKWVVTSGLNRTCLRLDAAIQFKFKYEQTDEKSVETYLNVPKNASKEESSCEENTLTLTFDGNTFSLKFVHEDGKVCAKLANLTYTVTEAVFPGAKDIGQTHNVWADNLTLFSVSEGKSYLCKEASKIDFTTNITGSLTDIQVEAFKNSTSDSFSTAEECSSDKKISDIVPIAVGCALAALVIIVLIAYLVGRQRTRQRGYQSV